MSSHIVTYTIAPFGSRYRQSWRKRGDEIMGIVFGSPEALAIIERDRKLRRIEEAAQQFETVEDVVSEISWMQELLDDLDVQRDEMVEQLEILRAAKDKIQAKLA